MPPYLPVRALNRSAAVRINKIKVLATATSYLDVGATVSQGQSVAKEIAYHSSIGQIYVVGPLTNTNSDSVVVTGGLVTNGAGLTVNVSAGELLKRSTGVYTAGAAATNFALTVADGTQDRTDLIHWDATSGAVGKTDGTLAAAGNSVAPATPAGKVPLATVLVAATVVSPGTKTDVRPRP